jgi:hypothetical protein
MQPILSVQSNDHRSVNRKNVYFSLLMRSFFFLMFGLIFVGILTLQGSDHPFQEAEKWWPYQVIFANLLTFLVLKRWLGKEGRTFRSLFEAPVVKLGKKVREYLLLILLAVIGGAIPLYLFSYLILGSVIPPSTHFQALPIEYAAIALVLFPLTNALVETPTYIGYALPRLQTITNRIYMPILLAGLGLALQHVFLPIVIQPDYMLWRLVSFIPLAIILGFFFTKTKSLTPIVVVHFLMDFQLVMQMFVNSVN